MTTLPETVTMLPLANEVVTVSPETLAMTTFPDTVTMLPLAMLVTTVSPETLAMSVSPETFTTCPEMAGAPVAAARGILNRQ